LGEVLPQLHNHQTKSMDFGGFLFKMDNRQQNSEERKNRNPHITKFGAAFPFFDIRYTATPSKLFGKLFRFSYVHHKVYYNRRRCADKNW
jgi:hypothetical protein